MSEVLSSRFHGYYDAEILPNVAYRTEEPRPTHWTDWGYKHFTIQEWRLSYHFYPHFHPYVAKLVRRLNEGSVRGLQAVDTEYQKNKDGTLEILPGSLLAALPGSVKVTLPGSTQADLPAGTHITLPENSDVTLPSGKKATLPGKMVTTLPRGIRVTVGASTETISFGEKVTLVAGTPVTRPDGTLATLPAGTSVTLLACKPKPNLYEGIFSESSYDPSPQVVAKPYPVKDLDFTSSGAYSAYNWELFYHVPITIAIHLSKNQRFEEAMSWFHYVFDPTDDSDGPTPERFWKVKPFQYTDVKMVEEILTNLSTKADTVLWEDTVNNINEWENAPFRPHVIARYRQSAYMFKTVMAYLDNLIAWGDTLFRQDTGESINEATQLYVLAANILGPRPQAVPKKGSVRAQTYDNLRTHLNEFGNALVDLETEIPFDLAPPPNGASNTDQFGAVPSLGATLYFCVPRNEKLLGYWDTVADRLFKIRNSLNIQGIFRQLPLFEPPIDPALLAKAAAAGLDVGAIVSGANQPLPLVRFQFLVQKAGEICQEVKTLGNNLLSAVEKEDNEALSVLRARHERVILGMAETVKYSQWQEAIKAREGLEKSRDNAIQRYTYYGRLLGDKDEDIKKAIPQLEPLDTDGLDKMKFRANEPEMGSRNLEVDIAQDAEGIAGGKKISSHELQEFNLLEDARGLQDAAAIMDLIGSYLSLIPQFEAAAEPVGVGAGATFGGEQLSKMLSMMASMTRTGADQLTYAANKTSKIGSYARREQEWAYQSNLAAAEITQTFKQLRAAQIREAIAEREWKNHKQQIENAEDIEHFLKGEDTPVGDGRHRKTSTKDFYTWMKREVKGLYGQCFQFAFDIARKAERALQHELGDPRLSFLEFGYLSGKEGLLAGEKLYLDIKRMEMAYHDLNQREYELTKEVSLLEVDPRAFLQLRETGHCTVFLPEELFDMGCPGHYFRRIKSVAVSIPCVTGPYTSVNCTLTLLKSRIRRNPVLREGSYAYEGAEDDRFSEHFGSLQSIVTSRGQTDSGLFETNLRDERYLPFEGSGAVSEWQLELPADVRQFDYDTISDVILHLRYTAREGGGLLRNGAVATLKARIDEAGVAGSVRLFSVRHEFPTEWARFKSANVGLFAQLQIKDVETYLTSVPYPAKSADLIAAARNNNAPQRSVELLGLLPTAASFDDFAEVEEHLRRLKLDAGLTLKLRPEHYPFWSKDILKIVKRADVFARVAKDVTITPTDLKFDPKEDTDTLVVDPSLSGLRAGELKNLKPSSPTGELTLCFDDNSMEDLWLALAWGKED